MNYSSKRTILFLFFIPGQLILLSPSFQFNTEVDSMLFVFIGSVFISHHQYVAYSVSCDSFHFVIDSTHLCNMTFSVLHLLYQLLSFFYTPVFSITIVIHKHSQDVSFTKQISASREKIEAKITLVLFDFFNSLLLLQPKLLHTHTHTHTPMILLVITG